MKFWQVFTVGLAVLDMSGASGSLQCRSNGTEERFLCTKPVRRRGVLASLEMTEARERCVGHDRTPAAAILRAALRRTYMKKKKAARPMKRSVPPNIQIS